MKNKKELIFLIIAVVSTIFILGAISVYANFKENGLSNRMSNVYEQKKDVAQTKVLQLYEDKNILTAVENSKIQISKNNTVLEYKETINYGPDLSCDVYVDINGNKYEYDSNGILKGFSAQLELAQDEISAFTGSAVSREEAISLAQKYAGVLYGDCTSEYELHRFSQLQDGTYSLSLVKNFGKEKFIIGPKLSVEILPNGNLLYCKHIDYDIYDGFDFGKLDGITKKEVLEHFEHEIYKEFAEGTEYEYSGIYLSEIDGEFKIHAVVLVTGGNEDFPVTLDREYYYELG